MPNINLQCYDALNISNMIDCQYIMLPLAYEICYLKVLLYGTKHTFNHARSKDSTNFFKKTNYFI